MFKKEIFIYGFCAIISMRTFGSTNVMPRDEDKLYDDLRASIK